MEPLVKDDNNSRESTTFKELSTLDEILLSTTEPNNDILKKEENEMEEIRHNSKQIRF